MPRTFRVGAHFDVADPFWVLVREGVYQCTQPYGIDIIPIDADTPYLFALSTDEQISLISGEFIAQHLAGRGRVLVLGGGVHGIGGDGKSRVAGMSDALRAYPQISTQRLPSLWTYEEVCQQLRRFPWPPGEHFDAVFGLSDPIALAASEVGRELGLIDERTIVVGINGDPLALAAIVNGTLTATVQTSTSDLAQQAVDLACQAARKEPLPTHFSYKPTLVTAENVSESDFCSRRAA